MGDFFAAADWSFASAILFGQAIVKIVSAGVINKNSASPRIVLIITLLFIMGVTPCLILIAIILLNDANSIYIMTIQVILYIVATSIFFWIGSAAHVMIDEVFEQKKKAHQHSWQVCFCYYLSTSEYVTHSRNPPNGGVRGGTIRLLPVDSRPRRSAAACIHHRSLQRRPTPN